MDTRTKIIPPAQALETAQRLRYEGTKILLVSGYFDVLQPALLSQLTALTRPRAAALFALVLDPPKPLLPARARAELAAALQVIDYVIDSSSEPAGFLAALAPDHYLRAEEEHLASRQHLIRHVLERHSQSAPRRQDH